MREYINRIGAEELGFRRFMVKTNRGHYYYERCLIKISSDGAITVTNKDYEPTAQEAAAIKEALIRCDFPRSIPTTQAHFEDLQRRMPDTSTLYAFYDRRTGGIIMAQERCVIDGRKAYIPWSFWSDGVWRRMEPEGALPFWKPPTPTGSNAS